MLDLLLEFSVFGLTSLELLSEIGDLVVFETNLEFKVSGLLDLIGVHVGKLLFQLDFELLFCVLALMETMLDFLTLVIK